MLLVCLSHFMLALSYAAPDAFAPGNFLSITAVASPTFMIVSGMTFGYLLAKSGRDRRRTRVQMIDRAFVLLIPVHVLVRLPHLFAQDLPDAVRVIEITDTIAVALLLNLLLIRIESHGRRLAVAAALFAGSWWLNLTWTPDGPVATAMKDVLVLASWNQQSLLHGFAVLPWAALHLAATVLGERLANPDDAKQIRGTARIAGLVGMTAMAIGIAAKVGHVVWRETLDVETLSPLNVILSTLVSPFGKYPAAPGYFAFCGGAALIFIAAIFALAEHRRVVPVARRFAVIGRTPLVVWVAQAWIYWGLVQHLPVPGTALLPLYFAATLAPIWMTAYVFDRNGWKRFTTLGIPEFFANAPRGTTAANPVTARASS